ncbi:MAG TPA: Lrp/AsnC ligand binding domain-containing protein [Nitrososphaeraceae archaeon]
MIICDPEYRFQVAHSLEKIENVVNVDVINGPYDLVVEIIFDTMEDLKEKIQNNIQGIDNLMSTLTLILSDDM